MTRNYTKTQAVFFFHCCQWALFLWFACQKRTIFGWILFCRGLRFHLTAFSRLYFDILWADFYRYTIAEMETVRWRSRGGSLSCGPVCPALIPPPPLMNKKSTGPLTRWQSDLWMRELWVWFCHRRRSRQFCLQVLLDCQTHARAVTMPFACQVH